MCQQFGQTEMPGHQIHTSFDRGLQQVQNAFEEGKWQILSVVGGVQRQFTRAAEDSVHPSEKASAQMPRLLILQEQMGRCEEALPEKPWEGH